MGVREEERRNTRREVPMQRMAAEGLMAAISAPSGACFIMKGLRRTESGMEKTDAGAPVKDF